MLFISNVPNYVPIKLCKTAGSKHLFKIKGTLKSGNGKLNRNYLWDTLEVDWNKVTVIELPRLVTIKIQDRLK